MVSACNKAGLVLLEDAVLELPMENPSETQSTHPGARRTLSSSSLGPWRLSAIGVRSCHRSMHVLRIGQLRSRYTTGQSG